MKQREDAVLDKEKALQIASEAIETRLAALQEAEESLRATLAVADKAAETDLTQLTDVYQNMKTQRRSRLVRNHGPDICVRISVPHAARSRREHPGRSQPRCGLYCQRRHGGPETPPHRKSRRPCKTKPVLNTSGDRK